MIAKVTRGDRIQGLVAYLYGPGRHEEHVDPHLIAAWAPSLLRDPRPGIPGQQQIAREMDAVRALFDEQVPGGSVYQFSLRCAPEDRALTDTEWADVARGAMADLELLDDPTTGQRGIRWIAVRHADDHIHVAAVLVREDGTAAKNNIIGRRDYAVLRRVCERAEDRYKLRHTGRGAGTPGLSRGEYEWKKRGQVSAREDLARKVRGAATQARTEAEFVNRLRAQGCRLHPRWASTGRRRVVGYSISPASVEGRTFPYRWGGRRLASDLTLPALRTRWPKETTKAGRQADLTAWKLAETGERPQYAPDKAHAAHMWDTAAGKIGEAQKMFAALDPQDHEAWSTAASDTAGNLAVLAAQLEKNGHGPLTKAVDQMARAAQFPTSLRKDRSTTRGPMPGVARVASTAVAARGGSAGTAVLLAQLGRTIRAVEAANNAGGRAQHAAAARAAAEELNQHFRTMHAAGEWQPELGQEATALDSRQQQDLLNSQPDRQDRSPDR